MFPPINSKELGFVATDKDARRELRGFFVGFSLSEKLSERHRRNSGSSLADDLSFLGGLDVMDKLERCELRFFWSVCSSLSLALQVTSKSDI